MDSGFEYISNLAQILTDAGNSFIHRAQKLSQDQQYSNLTSAIALYKLPPFQSARSIDPKHDVAERVLTQLERDLLARRAQPISNDHLLTLCILPFISRKFGEQAQWRIDRGETPILSRELVSCLQGRETQLRMIFQLTFFMLNSQKSVKCYHRVKELAGIEEIGML